MGLSQGIKMQVEIHQLNTQYDDLVNLMNRNFTLEPVQQPAPQQQQQPIIYASTHYTHSSHIPKSASEPPTSTHTPVQHIDATSLHPDLYAILIRNSINPSALTSAQLSLFTNADDDQKLRLLELWRISPPVKEQTLNTAPWFGTSLHQEEQLARLRWEKAEEAKQREEEEIAKRMRAAQDAEEAQRRQAELYMLSGYEALAQRDYERQVEEQNKHEEGWKRAYDPVFKGANMQANNGLWGGSIQQMENQYGVYEQLREQMGAYGAQSWGAQRNGLDEEMVM